MTPTDHPHFHGEHRGCKIVSKKQPAFSRAVMIDGHYCQTHKVDLCGSCDWEWDHGLTEKERARHYTPGFLIPK